MRTGGRLEVCVEQRVHQSAFAQAGLADAQDVEDESILDTFVYQLVGQAIEPDMSAELQVPQMVFVLRRNKWGKLVTNSEHVRTLSFPNQVMRE